MPAVPIVMAVAAVGSAVVGAVNAHKAQTASGKALSIAGQEQQWHNYFNQQLADLMADPSKIKDDPGYKQAIQEGRRASASRGMTGSGNEEAALFGISGGYINQKEQLLASAAGANVPQAGMIGAGVQAQGQSNAMTLQALQALGYAAGSFSGSGGSSGGGGGNPSAYQPPTATFDSSGSLFQYANDPYIMNTPGEH